MKQISSKYICGFSFIDSPLGIYLLTNALVLSFEFVSWLSPEFKLYLITEFERLKEKELEENKIEWQASRLLTKLNYIIHTDVIKKYIIPTLTEKQKK